MEPKHEGATGENAVSSWTSHGYSRGRWWVEHGHGCHGRKAKDMGHQDNLQVSTGNGFLKIHLKLPTLK